jgi:hypothetical protein
LLTRQIVGSGDPPVSNDDDHLLGTGQKEIRQNDAWRMMAPFMLLICAFILGVYLLLGGRLWWFGESKTMTCPDHQVVYRIQTGDTCWDISKKFSMSLEQLEATNAELNCDALKIGRDICVSET